MLALLLEASTYKAKHFKTQENIAKLPKETMATAPAVEDLNGNKVRNLVGDSHKTYDLT
jgi:hypothetical protein